MAATGSAGCDGEACDADAPVVLAFGPNPWDGQWMNRQQLLSRLGRFGPVVYSMGAPQPGRRKVPRAGLRGGLRVTDNVWIDLPPLWLQRPTRFRWLRELMGVLAARRWRTLTARLSSGPLVVYVFHPKFWPEVKGLKPARLVYHAYDLYHLQGKGDYVFDREERALVAAADVVIASSAPIAARLRAVGARHVDIVENAADYDAFAFRADTPPPVPVDIEPIPSPRIGYTGALNRKVDFPLLLGLAQRLPHCQFVLIGRVGDLDEAGLHAVERLGTLANVHFVGFKDRGELPAYMAAMDVNIMAYRRGDDVWTEGIYPLKLHEYLAVGQPVVSTDLPAVRPFADVIRIATSPADWELALAEALDGRAVATQATRRERARLNSWDERVRQLRGLLQHGRADEPAPHRD
jgi:glycosyltransferase involved in cell wall biosynthesis